LDKDLARELHKRMVRIKTADTLFRNSMMRGELMVIVFPVAGHEAVAAGIATGVRDSDYLVATYRGLHHEIAKGVSLVPLFGEIMGKVIGIARGKGGAMHIHDRSAGLMLTSGVVGSGLPMANGLALACQVKSEQRVVVCCFGDGATNSGAFHEAMNLAVVWKLPVIFVCENNRYSEGVPSAPFTASDSLVSRAAAYEMPAMSVDGYDPLAVHDAVAEAAHRARAGEGPSFIDAVCFRFFGHFIGDSMIMVPPEELEAERAKDPVLRFGERLVAEGVLTSDELTAFEQGIAKEVESAFDAAKSDTTPQDPAAMSDVLFSTAGSVMG
jgi:acetoin:2,6-dichlorophenolindophenol oxidoreductase subunit alpha